LDAGSGKPLWKQQFPTRYVSTIAPDDGPRCVPVIHEESVFLFGADGDLHALRMADGSERWSRNVNQEYSPPPGYFGAGSTPIVEAGKLLVNVGGRGAGVVAFSLPDGKTLWQATDEAPSYSSPVTATFSERRQAVFVTRLSVVALDPATGKVQFQFPFGQRGPTVNAANPLVAGKQLFVTASYGIGAHLAAIDGDKVTDVWENDSSLSCQYSTPVEKDGVLYGLHGRQDAPPAAELRAVELQTGKVLWSEKNFGAGNLIRVGDKLLIMKIDGELVLVEANPKQYRKLASHKIFDTTVQPLPALAGGYLYVRDTKTLKCVDLRP
jgi:outer membrane protein assembly factor BamB